MPEPAPAGPAGRGRQAVVGTCGRIGVQGLLYLIAAYPPMLFPKEKAEGPRCGWTAGIARDMARPGNQFRFFAMKTTALKPLLSRTSVPQTWESGKMVP